MRKIYAERGLALESNQSDIKEDHIAMELSFMAYLCGQYGKEDTHVLLEEQQVFLKEHLLNWTDRFVADIETYARTEFYKAVGDLLLDILI